MVSKKRNERKEIQSLRGSLKIECRKNNPTYNEYSKETAKKWDRINTKILNFSLSLLNEKINMSYEYYIAYLGKDTNTNNKT